MIRELSKPFIMVDENGTVQNIAMFLSYEDANRITRAVYGDSALATEYNFLVQAGDKYINNVYYNISEDGTKTPAQYIATQEEQIRHLENDKVNMEEELTSTQLALTEQYEENLALEEEITNTQIALTELYERMV